MNTESNSSQNSIRTTEHRTSNSIEILEQLKNNALQGRIEKIPFAIGTPISKSILKITILLFLDLSGSAEDSYVLAVQLVAK